MAEPTSTHSDTPHAKDHSTTQTENQAVIEERLAFLERHIETLDRAVADQTRTIIAMRERENILIERLRALQGRIDDIAASDSLHERPPHY
ncbi:MAG: SlyX family protein [Thioalkalivibrionaceae bacterium]